MVLWDRPECFVRWVSLPVSCIYEASTPTCTTHIHLLVQQCLKFIKSITDVNLPKINNGFPNVSPIWTYIALFLVVMLAAILFLPCAKHLLLLLEEQRFITPVYN